MDNTIKGHLRRLQRLQRRHTPDNVSSPRPESRGPYSEDTQIRRHAPSPLVFSSAARGRASQGRPRYVRGLRDRLPGCDAEYFGMSPAVVLGQDLTEIARPVRDGAVA